MEPLRWSRFGARFARASGTLELMDDLGAAMSGQSVLMLGGGNPGRIPEVQRILQRRLLDAAQNPAEFDRMIANYAHPTGDLEFRSALAKLLAAEYGWSLGPENIALTAGSQTGFFLLFNLLAGPGADGTVRRILLPMTPEYVGYADLGVDGELFLSRRPAIEMLAEPFFKYRVEFNDLRIDDEIAAVCVSRPTNPTGNVLTDAELARLDGMCRAAGVPLIIDSAYGQPFPDILFTAANPIWNDNTILCMSLSKLGMPAVRTGIVIAAQPIIAALTGMTATLSLAVPGIGPVLTQPLLESREILRMSRELIKPFYARKAEAAVATLERALLGLPFRIHRPEGAIFLWLWFPGLPITSAELYRRLKAAGVLVLSGHHFFPGLQEPWRHRDECLRISFAQDSDTVERGLLRLAAEVKRAYAEGPV
jgi:valine--pyruvate aminotransferase